MLEEDEGASKILKLFQIQDENRNDRNPTEREEMKLCHSFLKSKIRLEVMQPARDVFVGGEKEDVQIIKHLAFQTHNVMMGASFEGCHID